MISVLRDGSHGNGIKVVSFPNQEIIRKISGTSRSHVYLENEVTGLNWYDMLLCGTSRGAYTLKQSGSYARVDIKTFHGFQVCYNAPLHKTAGYVRQVIDHYYSVWPKRKKVYFHGDLTLDNVIFTKDGPRIFDWEHFFGVPDLWGFDLAYLALSSLLLPSFGKERLNKRDLDEFSKIWTLLVRMGLSKRIAKEPILFLKLHFMHQNCWEIIRSQSPNKFFLRNVGKDLAKRIDALALSLV